MIVFKQWATFSFGSLLGCLLMAGSKLVSQQWHQWHLLWRAALCFVGVSSLPSRCKLLPPSSLPRCTCDNQKCPQLLSNDFVPGKITPRWIPKADLLTTVVDEPTTDKLLPSLVLRFCESVKLFFCSDGCCLRSIIVSILLAFHLELCQDKQRWHAH